MDEYNYYDDVVDSMAAIEGDFPTDFSFIEKSDGSYQTVKVMITPSELIMFPQGPGLKASDLKVTKIKIDDIEHFQEEGEVYREQVISGGGSGKINVGGAIVGDIIAGPAGMIIGGQRKVNEIKSETVTHDTRKVVLTYFINKKSKYRGKIVFNKNIKQFLLDNIPEKEYSIVELNKKKELIKDNSKNINTKDKIKELNEMLEEKLITKEEFEKKKKELLDKF